VDERGGQHVSDDPSGDRSLLVADAALEKAGTRPAWQADTHDYDC